MCLASQRLYGEAVSYRIGRYLFAVKTRARNDSAIERLHGTRSILNRHHPRIFPHCDVTRARYYALMHACQSRQSQTASSVDVSPYTAGIIDMWVRGVIWANYQSHTQINVSKTDYMVSDLAYVTLSICWNALSFSLICIYLFTAVDFSFSVIQ